MSIHVFYSKLSSRNENSALFDALRRLRKIPGGLLFSEETTAGGWYPWMDGNEHNQHAVAEA